MAHPPPLSLAEARRCHGENGRWENFARRILHHPEIRRQLWQRQEGRCARCSKPLKSTRLSVHHLNYEHFCFTDQSDRRRSGRGRCPPCQKCKEAEGCLEQLEALCRLCHHRLHRAKTQK
ncbi:hypothetical protein [Trichloromonas sp.]|uniref:hypothetical protein n=1 Tax=Trichloromonas sp. TaxID=3069249 RepID=UPI003D816EC7